jgi:hypothetical protein
MSSKNTPGFAVYNLRNSFCEEPNEINNCPVCKDLLLKFNIPPSTAVVDQALHYSGFHYDYSHLYECPSCQWWAIRESWLDIGANGWCDFLITGEKSSAWRQILANRDLYFEATTLPDSLKQLLIQKDRTNHFMPGDPVRLSSNVVVRQPLGMSPPLCVRGSAGVIVWNSEYSTQYAEQLKDWYVSENNLLQDVVKRAMLHEVQAALESGRCYAVRLEHIVPTETTEKFGLCRVDEIYLFNASNLERLPKA